MAGPETVVGRLAHATNAAVRTAWFGAHYVAARRSTGSLAGDDGKPIRLSRRLPGLPQLLAAMRDLVAADRRRVEEGVYPAPQLPALSLGDLRRLSRRFLDDAQEVARRRRQGSAQEVRAAPGLPRYYRQNFHFQTDGYLSAESAALYDFQVETLFGGMAGAMRRQALPLLADAIAGRDQRSLRLLEIGCGTGALTEEMTRAFPRLAIDAIDPSADYLAAARLRVSSRRVQFSEGFAESLPFPDASFDAAASCYLFHELPPKVRAVVAAELARVVKPGGIYIHVDSLQFGDTPSLDGLIEAFPILFHEPYYAGYAKADLAALFSRAGFMPAGEVRGFLTKASAFRRAEAAPA
jgi:ubiquinone/menaquinone biosynthesis C-methylase UbiE